MLKAPQKKKLAQLVEHPFYLFFFAYGYLYVLAKEKKIRGGLSVRFTYFFQLIYHNYIPVGSKKGKWLILTIISIKINSNVLRMYNILN